jgi:hypothetical protein
MWKKNLRPGPEKTVKTHPSPALVKTAAGKGLSERVFLPIAESQSYGIRFYIKASLIHGVWTIRAI